MRIPSLTVLILLAAIIFYSSCAKTDPPVIITNPCEELDTSGGIGFKIKDYPGAETEFEADTIFINNNVIFEANKIYSSVKWKIAYDPRTFTDKRVSYRFTAFPTEKLPVTMIGTRKKFEKCLPGDDGIDTVTKYFFIVDYYQSKMLGRFFCAKTGSPKDTTTIEIKIISGGNGDKAIITNFPTKNCGDPGGYGMGYGIGLSFRFFYENFNNSCGVEQGRILTFCKGFIPVQDSIIIDYKLGTTSLPFTEIWAQYRGIRVR